MIRTGFDTEPYVIFYNENEKKKTVSQNIKGIHPFVVLYKYSVMA